MKTGCRAMGMTAWLGVALLGVAVLLQGCSTTAAGNEGRSDAGKGGPGGSGGVASDGRLGTPDVGGDGASEEHSASNLGASYSCGSSTCVVGQSYCLTTTGGAGGSGGGPTPYTTSGCAIISQGTTCAANPNCQCLCALRGGCGGVLGCTCYENGGLVVVACFSV
jgi:hypothetical protein